jgi:hypothetical protein
MTTLSASIEKIEEDIHEYDNIVKMLDYHIAQNLVPVFKNKQVEEYYKFLNFVAKREVNNGAAITTFWGDYMKNENFGQQEA